MRIPDSIIDDIRNASDIVEVVGQYVQLKKRGKNYTGLCPIHQEKTPSFSVSADKQMFYCFGCAKGGNVFTFVMEHDKVSFVEAARTLARRAGITVPEDTPEDSAQATENEKLYAACRIAAAFFSETLSSPEGKLALEYFKHRGVTPETITRFGLGYAPNAWDSLAKKCELEHRELEQFERAGLVLRREEGSGYYDRFRGRAIFPIYSPSGRVVGFGARKMREDDPLGKYINSPETPIYDKSRNLYGLFQAREAIRAAESAILVEGYADLISLSQAGIQQVVASSGTALTEEQIRLLGKYTRSVTLVYDADSAGSKATLRGVDLVIEGGLDVNVVQLPPGEDPDSFVRKEGGDAFRRLLGGAVSFLDFKAAFFREQGLLDTPEGKTRAVRSIVETLARMKDELKRTFFLKSVAEKYDIYETVLFRELEKIMGKESARSRMDSLRNAGPARGTVPAPGGSGRVELPPAERDLVRVMLEHGKEAIGFVLGYVTPEQFMHPLARAAVELLALRAGEEFDPTSLVGEAKDPALRDFLAGLLSTKYEISRKWAAIGSEPAEEDPRKIAEDGIVTLRIAELERQIESESLRRKEAEERGESTLEIQQRLIGLKREKISLRERGLRSSTD